MYVWFSVVTITDTPFVCYACAHALNNAGELVERNHRLMRRAPRLESMRAVFEQAVRHRALLGA